MDLCANVTGEDLSIYSVITSSYYIIFGSLGLLVSNSYLNEFHSYLFATGIGFIIQHIMNDGGVHIPIGIVALLITSSLICSKLSGEIIKKWSGEYINDADMIVSIRGEKFVRLPSSFTSMLLAIYTIVTINFYSIFMVIPILLISSILMMVVSLKFITPGEKNFTKTRLMVIKVMIATIVGCIGLGTTLFCPANNWLWIRFFIGYPIANMTLSYSLFIQGQILLLMRGINLKRHTSIKGNKFIIIVHYTGRFTDR